MECILMGSMTRKVPSLPARWLTKNLFIPANLEYAVLDYGSGKGMDAKTYGWDMYDKWMGPLEDPNSRAFMQYDQYDIITCTYVLNTIDSEKEVGDVIWNVQELLKQDGVSFFAVRRDRKNLKGKNSRGFQWFVHLEGAKLIRENSTYAIYKVGKLCQVKPQCKTL